MKETPMGRQLYAYPEGPVGLDHRVHLLETQIRSLVDAVRLLAGSAGTHDSAVTARVEEILRRVEAAGTGL